LILLVQVGFLVHQLVLLEDRVGREQAGIIIAVTSGMAVLGRVAIGFVIDRLNQRLFSSVSMLSQALALTIIAFTNDIVVLYSACALFGASVGNMITFPTLIIRKEFRLVDFGMLAGLATAIGQITYAFGPMLLGVLRDFHGDYRSPLLICTALQIVAGVIVLLRGKESAEGANANRPL
jgi:cyanate permease